MIEVRTRKKRRFGLFLVLFALCIGGTGFMLILRQRPPVISPLPDAPQAKQNVLGIFRRKKNPDELAQKVNNIIGDALSDYSVYVEDYTSNFRMGLSETETFTAASVNKVPILAALYYEAQNGTINLDQDITLQTEEIQDYGTGSLRYAEPGTTYSIKTLARLMIKQSDNTASYILANEIIGVDKLQTFIDQWGMSQTNIVNNKTSNKDMAILFRKLHEEKIANHAYTEEMLSFLKDTDFETRLPAGVPKDIMVYHKVGSETKLIHDVGIITDGMHTYYLGVFTNDETDDAATEQLISKVSKVVYDYMRS